MAPGTLATVLWSAAALQHYDADLCEAAAAAAAAHLPGARAHHVSMALWSLAQLRHGAPDYFSAAAEEVGARKRASVRVSVCVCVCIGVLLVREGRAWQWPK